MFNINKAPFGSTPSSNNNNNNNNVSFFTSTPARFGESFPKPPTTPNFGAPSFTPFASNSNNSSGIFAPSPFAPSSNGQSLFGNMFSNNQSNDFFGNAFNFTPKPVGISFGQNAFNKPPSGSSSSFLVQTIPGTVVKFIPVKLTDTAIIKGINQTIHGINQCITCMKEYEDKSLEELRWEDYQANRKGPQENFFFNNNITNTSIEPMSMESSTLTLPQENLNKNVFGFKFGAVPPSSNAPVGLFGKSTFSFGNTTTPNYFNTTNTNNYQTQSNLFSPPTTNANIFNRTPVFNPTTIQSISSNQTHVYPGLNTNTTYSFGNSPAVTSTAVIGQSTFGFNSSSLIKPNLFNNNNYKSFPSLTNHANTNTSTIKYNPVPQNINNQPQQQQLINQHEQILSMSSNPYGLSDLLNNIKEIDNSIKDSTRATNPNELRTLLNTVKPEIRKINEKLQPVQIFRKADQSMFDGLEVDENRERNPKKLHIRKYSFINDINEEVSCNDLNMNNSRVETIPHVETNEIIIENPTGITLTRPEYYTVPPLEELTNYISEDGSCIIQGFTIGRLGYGNVYFPEIFDVSNLNLDELVHFCYKEVTIYPDESKKPPQGEGLNRRAQITLDKVWPYDKNTNTLITDIDELTEIEYADRLRRLCDRQQTKFVDYRPDTGSWVFRVEHFSKYGDGDDDTFSINEDFSKLRETLQNMVPLNNSYFNYFKIYSDVAAFKGRCFKIGWSKHLQFTTLIFINNIHENSIQINQIKTYNDSSILHECLEEHLNIQLNNSQYNFINNVPYFSSLRGFNLLRDHEKNCNNKNNFETDIWRLCSALWGEIHQKDIRKKLLTIWLQNVIEKNIIFNYNDGLYNTIMKYLSLYRIEEAAKLAFDKNNINLSLLISQLPSNIVCRNYFMQQLNIWKEMYDLIDVDLLKIYLLIAGLPKIEFDKTTICIYEQMNWFQVFAFYLWYINNPEGTIATGIHLYEYSFRNNNEIVKPDLRYQLLKYFSDNKYSITNILNPTYTLDYRLSWFLLQILESLNLSNINPKTKQLIHLNFAAQLEEMQQWHWAVFILLFIEDINLKTKIIRDVIGRNVEINNSSIDYIKKEQFLINIVKIPSKWIETSKATLAINQGKIQEAVSYLCYAEEWNKAYNLLMDLLFPNNFFCYDYEVLNKILTPFYYHRNILPNWEQGGGVILDFARLGIEYNNSITDDRLQNQSIRFRSTVVNIHTRFRDITDLSYIRQLVGRNWSVLDHLLN